MNETSWCTLYGASSGLRAFVGAFVNVAGSKVVDVMGVAVAVGVGVEENAAKVMSAGVGAEFVDKRVGCNAVGVVADGEVSTACKPY